MEKKFLIKDIFFKNQDKAFTWKEIKEYSHLFEDNDIVSVYYDDNGLSYILNVTREVLETDNISNEYYKNLRYEKYLELKKEFSDIETPTKLAEGLKEFAKEVTSSRDSLLGFLIKSGILDKDGNLTKNFKNKGRVIPSVPKRERTQLNEGKDIDKRL